MAEREEFSPEFEKFIERYMAEQSHFRRIPLNIFNTLTTLVIASLGLISALAWDHYLKSMFDQLFEGSETLNGLLAYAVVVTAATVIVTLVLGKKSRE